MLDTSSSGRSVASSLYLAKMFTLQHTITLTRRAISVMRFVQPGVVLHALYSTTPEAIVLQRHVSVLHLVSRVMVRIFHWMSLWSDADSFVLFFFFRTYFCCAKSVQSF